MKEERAFERKSKPNIEDTDDKDTDMECGAVWIRNMDHEERGYKDLRLLKYGLGEKWRKSAGQNIRQLKKYYAFLRIQKGRLKRTMHRPAGYHIILLYERACIMYIYIYIYIYIYNLLRFLKDRTVSTIHAHLST